jgi:hypothetical protein
MVQYQYSPLPQEPNVIRLLRLLPSKEEPENLLCELFEYTLRESVTATSPYEALSYVWGSEDTPNYIIIEGQELAVTQNLCMVLLHLRDREIPRIIWVDAVCINQRDETEKALQIQFMAAIYAKASRVITWLGEAQDDSHRALELIRIACEESETPSNTEQFKPAILLLLQRQWFRRVWVREQIYTIFLG